jgi:hypothetical protein
MFSSGGIEVVPRSADWLDAPMRMTWRNLTLAALLGAQVIGIAAARFRAERYFCWAPYDEITRFEVAVTIDGRRLTDAEVRARYRLPDGTRDNRSHANVIAVIEQFERTYGANDQARVEFNYRVNGGALRQWQWPFNSASRTNVP